MATDEEEAVVGKWNRTVRSGPRTVVVVDTGSMKAANVVIDVAVGVEQIKAVGRVVVAVVVVTVVVVVD